MLKRTLAVAVALGATAGANVAREFWPKKKRKRRSASLARK